MDTKRILIGTLAGGVTMYVLGYLMFELMFAEFYAANAGSATGVSRDPNLEWAVALGSLSLAGLLTLAIEARRDAVTLGNGFMTGAVVAFLLWLGVDLISYGLQNVANLTRALVDPLFEFVRGGATGAVIASVLARMGQPEPRAYMRT